MKCPAEWSVCPRCLVGLVYSAKVGRCPRCGRECPNLQSAACHGEATHVIEDREGSRGPVCEPHAIFATSLQRGFRIVEPRAGELEGTAMPPVDRAGGV